MSGNSGWKREKRYRPAGGLHRQRAKLIQMTKFFAAILLVLPLAAQDAKPFLGRWDVTVTPATGTPYPQWLEVVEKAGKIEGRIQPRGGAWHTFTGAEVRNNHLMVP